MTDSLVYSRGGDFFTDSRRLAEFLGSQHKDVLKGIEREIAKLTEGLSNERQLPPNEFQPAIMESLEGFKEITYIDAKGRSQRAYELTESAAMQIVLKFSAHHRALFIYKFRRLREAIINMFKLRIIDNVLPKYMSQRQYVYVIQNTTTGNIKVGISNDPNRRLSELQTGNDCELKLVYRSYLCSNALDVEDECHQHFADRCVRGEWFAITPQQMIDFLEHNKFVLDSSLDVSFDVI